LWYAILEGIYLRVCIHAWPNDIELNMHANINSLERETDLDALAVGDVRERKRIYAEKCSHNKYSSN
jgi:hypothetical protein